MTASAQPLSIAHLINPRVAGDPACIACAALIKHAPDWARHTCIVAQQADDVPRAELLGLPTRHRIPPRATARLSRARQLEHVWREIGAPPDILIVWPGMPMPSPDLRTITINADRLDAGPWPIDAELVRAHPREEVRDAWGIPDGARVLASIAEPAQACDAWAASYLGAVLTLATPPTWVVVPAGADEIDRGLRFAERHEHRWGVIVDDAPLPRVLAGADAVVHALSPSWGRADAQPRAAGLAWATALALPIVAQATPAIDQSAPHLARASIVAPGNHRALAHAMTKAMLDDDLEQRRALARKTLDLCDPASFARRAHEHLSTLVPGAIPRELAPAR